MAEKRDCSNIFVFIEEWERRRKMFNEYDMVPAAKDIKLGDVVKYIEELQKFSDEHPRQTRREKFIQMCRENGFERVADNKMQCTIFETYIPCLSQKCEECKEYWDGEVD